MLPPTVLRVSVHPQPIGSTIPGFLCQADCSFELTAARAQELSRPDYELQVVCVLLTDPVQPRFHWPCHAALRVTPGSGGKPPATLPVPCRTMQYDLGKNGRDPPAAVPRGLLQEGRHRVALAGYDNRQYSIMARRPLRRAHAAPCAAATPAPAGAHDRVIA